MEKMMFNMEEAAKILNVGKGWLYGKIKEGKIKPAFQNLKTIRFSKDQLETFKQYVLDFYRPYKKKSKPAIQETNDGKS
jgi:excisionase family DNA binding protein